MLEHARKRCLESHDDNNSCSTTPIVNSQRHSDSHSDTDGPVLVKKLCWTLRSCCRSCGHVVEGSCLRAQPRALAVAGQIYDSLESPRSQIPYLL